MTVSRPVVIDLSLSKVARGQVLAAQQRGEPIPLGWALDAAGEPTTDPAAALAGTMLPMGDAKGTALALMVEALAAGLTGASYAADASPFLNADGGPPDTGQLMIAIDPERMGGSGGGGASGAAVCGPGGRAGRTVARSAATGIASRRADQGCCAAAPDGVLATGPLSRSKAPRACAWSSDVVFGEG